MGSRPLAAVFVGLLCPGISAAVVSDTHLFSIAGAPPMSRLSIEAAEAVNASGTKFSGAGALSLDDGRRIAVRVVLRVKKTRSVYTIRSTGGGLPRFKGSIVTSGDPEVVTKTSLVLRLTKKKVVKQKNVSAVQVTPPFTTTTFASSTSTTATTVTSTTSTTTSTTVCVPSTAGTFSDPCDGTILDSATGLQWEKKERGPDQYPSSNLHDVDNLYSWAGLCTLDLQVHCQPDAAASATCLAQSNGGTFGCGQCGESEGTCNVDPRGDGIKTTVWGWLNAVNAANFAGHDDWRLPSESACNTCWSGFGTQRCPCGPAELESLQLAPFPCRYDPCIAPIFGPTGSGVYWSASSSSDNPVAAWIVDYYGGSHVQVLSKSYAAFVRAVR